MSPAINSDTAYIPAVNFTELESDPSAPATGHALLYVKGGVVYVRTDAGDPVSVGGSIALPDGRLAVGDANGDLSALALGTEGQVVTADANGKAAWATPGASEAGLVKIAEVTLADSNSTSIDFADIPQTYRHLRLLAQVRGTNDASNQSAHVLRFNDDDQANYDFQYNYFNGTGGQGGGSYAAGVYIDLGLGASGGSPANTATVLDISIPYYRGTTFYKQLRSSSGWQLAADVNGQRVSLCHGLWRSTSAITKISLQFPSGPQWLAGSTASLYGLT